MNNNMLIAREIFNELNSGGSSKMPVGIHTNCKFTEAEVGDNYIDFHFETTSESKTVEGDQCSAGQVQNNRVWFPDPNKVWPREGETDQDAYQRSRKEKGAQIVKMMDIFLDKEVVDNFQAPTFQEFASRAAQLLNQSKHTQTVNLKVIYDKEGQFTELAGRFYPNYVETYVADGPVTLKYSNWEKTNRLTKKAPAMSLDTNIGDAKGVDNLV